MRSLLLLLKLIQHRLNVLIITNFFLSWLGSFSLPTFPTKGLKLENEMSYPYFHWELSEQTRVFFCPKMQYDCAFHLFTKTILQWFTLESIFHKLDWVHRRKRNVSIEELLLHFWKNELFFTSNQKSQISKTRFLSSVVSRLPHQFCLALSTKHQNLGGGNLSFAISLLLKERHIGQTVRGHVQCKHLHQS